MATNPMFPRFLPLGHVKVCRCINAAGLLHQTAPSAVAMDIIGHDTEAISRHYTHIESETKRSALNKLPKLL